MLEAVLGPLRSPPSQHPWVWSVMAVFWFGPLFGIWVAQATDQSSLSPQGCPGGVVLPGPLGPPPSRFCNGLGGGRVEAAVPSPRLPELTY